MDISTKHDFNSTENSSWRNIYKGILKYVKYKSVGNFNTEANVEKQNEI